MNFNEWVTPAYVCANRLLIDDGCKGAGAASAQPDFPLFYGVGDIPTAVRELYVEALNRQVADLEVSKSNNQGVDSSFFRTPRLGPEGKGWRLESGRIDLGFFEVSWPETAQLDTNLNGLILALQMAGQIGGGEMFEAAHFFRAKVE